MRVLYADVVSVLERIFVPADALTHDENGWSVRLEVRNLPLFGAELALETAQSHAMMLQLSNTADASYDALRTLRGARITPTDNWHIFDVSFTGALDMGPDPEFRDGGEFVISSTMRKNLERVARGDIIATEGPLKSLLRRGLIVGRWSGSTGWEALALTDKGIAALGRGRVKELKDEAAAKWRKQAADAAAWRAREAERGEELAANPPSPKNDEDQPTATPVSAQRISAQLRRAGWNPRYKNRHSDGLQVHQFGDSATVVFRYAESPAPNLPAMVEEITRTLQFLGYIAEHHGEATETSGTVFVSLPPSRKSWPRYPSASCPLCDRGSQPLKKLRKNVYVFYDHNWLDRVTPCEASGYTPDQAQKIKDNQAPKPERRLKPADDKD